MQSIDRVLVRAKAPCRHCGGQGVHVIVPITDPPLWAIVCENCDHHQPIKRG